MKKHLKSLAIAVIALCLAPLATAGFNEVGAAGLVILNNGRSFYSNADFQSALESKVGIIPTYNISSCVDVDYYGYSNNCYRPYCVRVNRPVKYILPISTIVAGRNSYDGAAVAQMLLQHRWINTDCQRTIAREISCSNCCEGGFADIDLLLSYINTELFGYAYIDSDAGLPSYRAYRLGAYFADYAVSKSEAKTFIHNLQSNILSGYPMVLDVNSSYIYPGTKAESRFVLCTGFKLNPKTGSVEGVYFIDPNKCVQDRDWDGLKYIDLDSLLDAIAQSKTGLYLG